MLRRFLVKAVVGLGVLLVITTGSVHADPPRWATLIPFKRVEADPNKAYELSEAHGPWMIMCTSFAGPTAQQQAHELVIELRQKFKLEAFSFPKTFDFSQPDATDGLGYNQYGERKRMKYLNPAKFDEIAVLVGNFGSLESPEAEKALDVIKHAKPAALGDKYGKQSSQRFVGLRSFYNKVSLNTEKKQRGPMGSAFITRNPLLPEEYFNSKGLDPFLVEINEDLEFSLLKCPGNYTVRVATFRGVDTMKPAEFEKMTTERRSMAKIDEAAVKASKMCAALRARGIEAYEFHDRTESMVTVGSFKDYGQPRQDGKTEINPAMHRIMQEFGPIKRNLPGTGTHGIQARTEAVQGYKHGIAFDPDPWPVQVPRQTVGAAYNPSRSPYQ